MFSTLARERKEKHNIVLSLRCCFAHFFSLFHKYGSVNHLFSNIVKVPRDESVFDRLEKAKLGWMDYSR